MTEGCGSRKLLSPLSDNFEGLLAFTQPLEARLSKFPFIGPLRYFGRGDQLCSDPLDKPLSRPKPAWIEPA